MLHINLDLIATFIVHFKRSHYIFKRGGIMKKLVSLVAVMFVAVAGAFASDASIIKLSLVGPVCVPKTNEVTGLDLGILGTKTSKVTGIQFAIGMTQADEMVGIQSAWIMSKTTKKFTGLQGAIVTSGEGDVVGVQYGIVNKAENMTGLQLGWVNWANHMQGVQLGLVNTIKTGPLPVFVFINANF